MSTVKSILLALTAVTVSIGVLAALGASIDRNMFDVGDETAAVIYDGWVSPVVPLPDDSCEECPPMDALDGLPYSQNSDQTFVVCPPPFAINPATEKCTWMEV